MALVDPANPLLHALVKDHILLYETSVSFHHAIDALVGMLPLMVNGLAAEAEVTQAEIAADTEAARRRLGWWSMNGC